MGRSAKGTRPEALRGIEGRFVKSLGDGLFAIMLANQPAVVTDIRLMAVDGRPTIIVFVVAPCNIAMATKKKLEEIMEMTERVVLPEAFEGVPVATMPGD